MVGVRICLLPSFSNFCAGTSGASRWSKIVSRWSRIAVVLALVDDAAEVAGAVGRECVCFVEVAVGEGRRHCSLATVARVAERGGCSPGVRSQGWPAAAGSQDYFVAAGSQDYFVVAESQGLLAEEVGRRLFCEHCATRKGLCNRRTGPAIRGGWSISQRLLPTPSICRDSRGKYPACKAALWP